MNEIVYCWNKKPHFSCYAAALPWWSLPLMIATLALLIGWVIKKRVELSFKEECEANKTTSENNDKTIQYPEYSVRRKNYFGKKIGLYVRMPPGRKIELFSDFLEKYDVIFGMTLGAPIKGGAGRSSDWYYLPRTDFDDVKKILQLNFKLAKRASFHRSSLWCSTRRFSCYGTRGTRRPKWGQLSGPY